MEVYFAPMEGITGYIFRNAYQKYYGGVQKYFGPFISPNEERPMLSKDRKDMDPEHNAGVYVVPQILTNKVNHFIKTAVELQEMGYKEVNLNLGCPSGTVCAKGKGAGFLSDTDALDSFLETIYNSEKLSDMKISLKTRLGRFDPEEYYTLLEIYNRYPVEELIVHPRIQKDYYKGDIRMEYYDYGVEHSVNPVIYNGDLVTVNDLFQMEKKYTTDVPVMIGRGLLMNPELLEHYKGMTCKTDQGIELDNNEISIDLRRFRAFHDEIYQGYREIMSPDKTVLYRMKELWTYWKTLFPENQKTIKKILKSRQCAEYNGLVKELM